jgi:hypothetical protein
MGNPKLALSSIAGRAVPSEIPAAFLIIVMEENQYENIGSKAGSRNMKRIRKGAQGMFLELGHRCRKAHRMLPKAFLHVHLHVSLHALLDVGRCRNAAPSGKVKARPSRWPFSVYAYMYIYIYIYIYTCIRLYYMYLHKCYIQAV